MSTGSKVNSISVSFHNCTNSNILVPNIFLGIDQEMEIRHERELVSLLKSIEDKRHFFILRDMVLLQMMVKQYQKI